MKKNYVNPKTLIFQVEMQPLMDVSNTGGNTTVSVSENEYDGNSEILSRRGGGWSDED